MSTRFDASESRLTWKSRCVRVPLTIGVIGSLLLAACSSSDQQNSDPTSPGQTTQQSEQQVQNPTHVLQNVNLKLASRHQLPAGRLSARPFWRPTSPLAVTEHHYARDYFHPRASNEYPGLHHFSHMSY